MAQFPSLPLWTDAYLGDTTHLTTLEHGAYLLLLIAAWRSPECRLPNDDKRLARYAKLGPGQWRRIKDVVMEFFTVDGEWIYQGRLIDEHTFVKQRSIRQSNNVKARWLKNKETTDTTVIPNGYHSDTPTPTPTPNKEKIIKKKNGTRIKEGWKPTEKDKEYAINNGYKNGQISLLADSFKDYWLAASGQKALKVDWSAAWRTWVRNDMKFNGEPKKPIKRL